MFKKLLFAVLGILVFVVGGTLVYMVFREPAMAVPSSVKVEITPARLERGKYLFEVVADCAGCHSERDFTKFGGPVVQGGLGKGMVFPKELELPGEVVAPNLTPDRETGLGTWTDGEKIRAIREGISKDGRVLFPMMPYEYFRHMSDEDVYSVVAYLNSLPPVRNQLPRSKIKFPVNFLIKSVPKPAGAVAEVNRADRLKYGEYLTTLAGCGECHTPRERGEQNKALAFAGGQEFRVGPYLVVTPNITPHPETGIGNWSEERFVAKFTGYRSFADGTPPAVTQANFTLMPWLGFARMREDDIRAIYAFLRTVPAKENAVTVHPEYAPPSGS